MDDKRNFGFKQSPLDGNEYVFGAGVQQTIPEKYSLRDFMPPVYNQGDEPICVPVSISTYLNWRENLKDGSKKDNKIKYYDIFNVYGQSEGMTFKEAFKHLRKEGVNSNAGVLKINTYAKIKSAYTLRLAIIMNGPCFGALPVYNSNADFWNKQDGDTLLAYHAIAIVGYDKDGFIIRNSWGTSFADKGYTKISIEEMNKFIELWTVVN